MWKTSWVEGRVWERLVHPAHLFSLRHHRVLAVHFNELGRGASANVEEHPGSYLDCVIWESYKNSEFSLICHLLLVMWGSNRMLF